MKKASRPPKKAARNQPGGSWRQVFNAANEAIFIHDAATGRILDVNDRVVEMFGYPREEVLQLPSASGLLSRSSRAEEEVRAWIQKAADAGPQTVECHARRKNGELFWCEIWLRKIEDGLSGRVLAVARDITQRKQAEEALRRSEERHRLLFHGATHAVLVHEFNPGGMPGRFIEVNEAACRRYGYTREEMLRMRPMDIDAPEGLEAIPEAVRRLNAEGRATWEGTHVTKDGRKIPVEITSILFDLQGEPTVLSSVRDITERKQAEAQVRFQALLLDQIGDTVTATDLDGKILFVNEAQCRAVKRTREELINASVQAYGDDPARGATQLEIIEATRSQGSWRGEVINHDSEGREFVIDCRTTLVRDAAGEPVGMCGVGTDITERMRLERDLAANAARLQAIVEAEPECVKIVSPEGDLLEMNPAGLKMLQAESPAQVQNKPLLSFVSPEYQAAFRELHERVMRGESGTLEFEAIGLKGGRRWLETHAVPLRDPATGCTHLLGVTRDVTSRKWAEQALRQAHQLEHLHFDQTPLGVIEWDLSFRVTRWNPAAERVFGHSAAEALGRHASFIVPESVRPQIDALWDQLLARQGGERSTNENLHKDGRNIFCEWYNTPLVDEQGRVIGVASLVMDVTNRRRAEEQLRDSERLYHSLFDLSPSGILLEDTAATILEVNPAMCRIFGYSREEMRRRNVRMLVPPEHHHEVDQHIDELLSGKVLLHELDNIGKDGESRRVQVHEMSVPLPDGRRGILAIVNDITEHKRAEEALRQSRVDLERAQAIGHIGSWISDLNPPGKLAWSAETCRIFGLSENEFDGRLKTFLEMVHPEDVAALQAAKRAAVAGDTHYDFELRIIRRDGALRWVHEKAEVECAANGDPIRMVGVVQDITERRQLEEQLRHLQKMESVGQLAAGVAHDFNNILTVINGSSSILSDLLKDRPECMEWVAHIAAAGDRAANLTRQLLLFSRKQQLQPKPVNLNELTSNLTKMLGRVLGEDITLEFSYDNDLLPVQGDAGMLEQVIINLAVNARDAMPEGGRLHIATSTVQFISAPISANPKARLGRFVRLAVRDTGVGIPPEIRERIFEPFFTTKEVGKGTGLGLATVFGIITQHEGWIEVDSEVGRGTTFLIYLPASPASESEIPGRSTPTAEPGHGETILVVEDDLSVRELEFRALTRQGYDVMVADSGAQALQIPHERMEQVSLLVTDLVMPGGINGRELAETLRRMYPQLRVIYCSGYSPEIAGGRLALEQGVTFVQKPFTPRELLDAITACLRS
jgi:PAS domain S-box-containing protein